MVKTNSILTIDVGADSLKLAEFSVDAAGGLVLDAFAFRKLEDSVGRDNDFSGPSSDRFKAEVFRQALVSAMNEGNFQSKSVRLSLSAGSAFLRLNKLPEILGNRETISKVVEYEAQQAVPCAMSEVEWDYQLVHHEWQETVEETGEDGKVEEVKVDRDEYEALFVAIKHDQISLYTNIIEEVGLEVLSVTVAPVALFNAARVTQLAEDNGCTIMLNIGGACSTLVISDGNRVFLRSIPTAGNVVTAQIAKEFGVTNEEAEELKRRHGFVSLGGAYDEPESEMAGTVSKIVRNVMTRLHGEVSRSINVWRSQYGGNQPVRIMLSGGASVMPGVTEFFQEKLRMPVEYLNTFGAISVGENVDKASLQSAASSFQELIGLALEDVIDCPVKISLLPREIRKQMQFERQKPYFLIAACVLILCFAIFGFGMARLADYSRAKVKGVEKSLKIAERVQRQVSGLMDECDKYKGGYEQAVKVLESRSAWTDILNDLQNMAPDMMWFSAIEGVSLDDNGNDSQKIDSVAKEKRLENIAAVREINAIKITGYTVIHKKNGYGYSDFQKKLENSGRFSEVKSVENFNASELGGVNMTKFVCVAKLKEPMKK